MPNGGRPQVRGGRPPKLRIGRAQLDHRLCEAINPQVAEKWYNDGVLSGRRKPIPIDKTKRCKAIVSRKPDKLLSTILMQGRTRTLACLSLYFDDGFIGASTEIGERPFSFSDGCRDNLMVVC